jgi:hypothetical protein
MNANFEITYLAGGDEVFGPTSAAPRCAPTPARASSRNARTSAAPQNMEFSLEMENEIMGAILTTARTPDGPARPGSREPRVLDAWLEGVTTRDGGDAKAAVPAASRAETHRPRPSGAGPPPRPRMDWLTARRSRGRLGRGRFDWLQDTRAGSSTA